MRQTLPHPSPRSLARAAGGSQEESGDARLSSRRTEGEAGDFRSHISGAGCSGDFAGGSEGPNAAGGTVYLRRGRAGGVGGGGG